MTDTTELRRLAEAASADVCPTTAEDDDARYLAAVHPAAVLALLDEVERLRRWKSTHAPRLEALEGLLRTAQLEAHGAREAIATLASERAANAILTAQVAALEVDAARYRWARTAAKAMSVIDDAEKLDAAIRAPEA